MTAAPDSSGPSPQRSSDPPAPRSPNVIDQLSSMFGFPAAEVRLRDPEGSTGQTPDGAGTQTGKYRVQGELGRGGVGVVLKGHDPDLGRDVAVKVLHERHRDNKELMQRFVEEAQIGGQLQHPGVVPVYDLGIADGRPFFTMKFVKGRTLAALLVERADVRADRRRFLTVFEQVCQTIAYAHARGVVHRDLKPANIMIGAFGEVQVADWGMGKVLHAGEARRPAEEPAADVSIIATLRSASGTESVAGSVMGTPAYMPPEQAIGDIERLDQRSDVFALGAILCEILTGQPPYVGPAHEALQRALRADLDDARGRLSGCGADPDLIALARQCLEPMPAARPNSAEQVAERVSSYLATAEQRAQDARLRATAARRTQKLAVSFGLIIAVALAASLLSWRRAENAADSARSAQAQERIARQDADAKAKALAEALSRYDSLALVVKLREAQAAAAALYPAWPEQVPAMRRWLDEQGRPLALAVPGVEAKLAAQPAAGVAAGQFAAETDQFVRDTLVGLLDGLRTFADPERGCIVSVERRLAWAQAVYEDSIVKYDREWKVAIEAIAQSPVYGGLVLRPQVGLIPLAVNPHSQLWEFVHLASGAPGKAIPQRNAVSGQLDVTEDTGLLFVLLPGGVFAMGAQKEDPAAPGYDPGAEPSEGPIHEVRLAPFFLAKHETTQAQWRRMSEGTEPSGYKAGSDPSGVGPISATHPVENVSWGECDLWLRRQGLVLPTEAQWEFASRAGTVTPWCTGTQASSLQGYANLADAAAERAGMTWPIEPGIDDGRVVHAPVGSYLPNGFGLFDMQGNVWEWCQDAGAEYSTPPLPGDGLRVGPAATTRVNRGGSFAFPAAQARSAYRYLDSPETRDFNLGVRSAALIRE